MQRLVLISSALDFRVLKKFITKSRVINFRAFSSISSKTFPLKTTLRKTSITLHSCQSNSNFLQKSFSSTEQANFFELIYKSYNSWMPRLLQANAFALLFITITLTPKIAKILPMLPENHQIRLYIIYTALLSLNAIAFWGVSFLLHRFPTQVSIFKTDGVDYIYIKFSTSFGSGSLVVPRDKVAHEHDGKWSYLIVNHQHPKYRMRTFLVDPFAVSKNVKLRAFLNELPTTFIGPAAVKQQNKK